MKIIMFGLTGLGSIVLESFIKKGFKILAVSTRKEIKEFPHFKCKNITEICNENKIPVYFDKTYFDKLSAELIVSATYHKKIELTKCTYQDGFNIHPSMLPHLKGRDPIKKALELNINKLGVSVHKLTDKFDIGQIIFQKPLYFTSSDTKKTLVNKLKPLYRKASDIITEKYTVKL
jgi:UDP-4-amino-4-deoxy-L-arabinose formyltransferase/UDP-glucuronic acid dehydrogenase (UDP-4-keto-hexauronic acid decarboxylating)